jgi:hypothetical protein
MARATYFSRLLPPRDRAGTGQVLQPPRMLFRVFSPPPGLEAPPSAASLPPAAPPAAARVRSSGPGAMPIAPTAAEPERPVPPQAFPGVETPGPVDASVGPRVPSGNIARPRADTPDRASVRSTSAAQPGPRSPQDPMAPPRSKPSEGTDRLSSLRSRPSLDPRPGSRQAGPREPAGLRIGTLEVRVAAPAAGSRSPQAKPTPPRVARAEPAIGRIARPFLGFGLRQS